MPRRVLTARDLPGDARGTLASNLERCRSRIAAAARRAGREPEDVGLLVVSKYVDVDVMRVLHDLGVREFGENRVQDALRKKEALGDLKDLRLHFVGHLQRNKARRAASTFASIQSLDSRRLATLFEEIFTDLPGAPPELYIEANLSNEPRKTGVPFEDLDGLLDEISRLPRVDAALTGFMGMAPYHDDPEASRPFFRRLRELRDRAVATGRLPAGAGLSMGMSRDYEVAVEEGATVVRIGSALYETPGP